MDIAPAVFTFEGAKECDQQRINLLARKSKEPTKKIRKTLRHLRKKYIDKAEEKERVMYCMKQGPKLKLSHWNFSDL